MNAALRTKGPEAPTSGPGAQHPDPGVEGNSRLTATTAVVLLVLLAVEGVTVLRVHTLLRVHVLVGMMLVPPVLVKVGSTLYRFGRYYIGAPAYRRKGPPPPLLRVLGPVVVITTLTVLASGVALVLAGPAWRPDALFVHKASFVIWFAAMVIHVLGHILETARLAPRDWARRTRADVAGARLRQWLVAGSVAAGLPLGLLLMNSASNWHM